MLLFVQVTTSTIEFFQEAVMRFEKLMTPVDTQRGITKTDYGFLHVQTPAIQQALL